MPSEEIETRILEALAGPIGVFESALAATAEQVRVAVEAHGAPGNGRMRDAGAEFGAFAAGRMDAARFASLLARSDDIDDVTFGRIRDAYATLTGLLERKEALFRVDIAPGAGLREGVARALAEIGRAFGAARTVDLARAGRFQPAEHDGLARAFAFRHWSRAERDCAPPLVVHVDGADLRAGGLLEFLDGALKIVLVVRGPAPPAPLVALVRPHTFVLQACDASGLGDLAAWEGPGVAALMPDGAARFRHDPAAGTRVWERLTIDFAPDAPPAVLHGYSKAQQAEDLEQLSILATRPPEPAAVPAPDAVAAPVAAPAATPAADPADRLAAWLLEQADLEGPA